MILISRADKKGQCYPSQELICKDTGIQSENTVRKAIRGLINRGLIFRVPTSRVSSTTYQVTHDIYKSIQIADRKYKEEKDRAMKTNPPPDEVIYPSRHKSKPPHQMRTKEYTEKKNPVVKEERENNNVSKLRLSQILKHTAKPLFDSELDPKRKAKADADLEHIRAQNLLREAKIQDERMN